MIFRTFMLGWAVAAAAPAAAKWTEQADGVQVAVAKSSLTVTPPRGWNQDSVRSGKHAESWSFDGPLLDRIDFYGAVGEGEALLKERNKKRQPLPKFTSTMLATDISEMFERTQRVALGTPDFTIDTITPADFAGRKGFRFSYHYTRDADNLTRRGLATGAVIGGKLYLVAYSAAAIHYYDAHLAGAQQIMSSAKL